MFDLIQTYLHLLPKYEKPVKCASKLPCLIKQRKITQANI